MKFLTSLEELDKAIKAIQDMLKVWDESKELKELLCIALEARALALLRNNKESENNDLLN